MFPSNFRSITNMRPVGRPTPFTLSTQTRSLYFCGPKPGDHDPDLPISQHYHARSRTTGPDATQLTASAQCATTTITATKPVILTMRIPVTHISSLPERHTMPSTNKLETIRKAIMQLEAATHDDTTTYTTAIVIVRQIARLEVMLTRGEAEGKQPQELQWIKGDIEELKNLWQRMERKISRD